MKISKQKSFKSLALAAAALLFFSASAVQASSACYDYCYNKAQSAGQTAAGNVVSERAPICHQMTGAARDACYADLSQRANAAYQSTFYNVMSSCMSSTQCGA